MMRLWEEKKGKDVLTHHLISQGINSHHLLLQRLENLDDSDRPSFLRSSEEDLASYEVKRREEMTSVSARSSTNSNEEEGRTYELPSQAQKESSRCRTRCYWRRALE